MTKIAHVELARLFRNSPWVQTLAVGAIVLLAGFGDGVGFALATLTGQRSPWIFLLPVLVVPLIGYLVTHGLDAIGRVERVLIVGFGAFSALVLVVQLVAIRDFYLAGLVQLLTFVLVAMVVCGVFATAPDWLARAFSRSLPAIHYFLCGYVVASFLTWHLTGWDSSIRVVLTDATARLDYYGFRPSGFGAEPAWTAIALAASYTGTHYLEPRTRLNAFIALVIAAEALQSATAYAFVGAVIVIYGAHRLRMLGPRGPAVPAIGTLLLLAVAAWAWLGRTQPLLGRARDALLDAAVLLQSAPAQVLIAIAIVLHQVRRGVTRRNSGHLALTGVLLTIGLAIASFGVAQPARGDPARPPIPTATPAAVSSPLSGSTQPPPAVAQPPLDRVNSIVTGRDPSASLRFRTAGVAWRVIEESFPLGVGYGNFRRHAVYPTDLEAFLTAVDEIERYKSDFFLLNYAAELGAMGVVLVLGAAALLVRTGHALTIAFVALIVGLSGTLLLPPVLAMSAVVGLMVRDAHLSGARSVSARAGR